jgi:hypothetical protein
MRVHLEHRTAGRTELGAVGTVENIGNEGEDRRGERVRERAEREDGIRQQRVLTACIVTLSLSLLPSPQPQGTWMGWIQTFGSLGRVAFPLVTKIFSVSFAFFLSSLGCGIAIIALLIYMKLAKMAL